MLTWLFMCPDHQAQLASPIFGANTSWVGAPQAALTGTFSGQQKTVLLELDT